MTGADLAEGGQGLRALVEGLQVLQQARQVLPARSQDRNHSFVSAVAHHPCANTDMSAGLQLLCGVTDAHA